MEVQVFGIQKHHDVRKALRFFLERRVRVHFVDLNERPASKGELRRFAHRFGVGRLIDSASKRYAELGLSAVRYDDMRWLATLANEPLMLVLPLVRFEHKLTVGLAEREWGAWVEESKT